MARFHSAHDLAAALSPEAPVLCIRPHAAMRAASWFVDHFPGRTFYAVKANPSPWLINALIQGGVTQFDVASIAEVRLLREHASDAELAFMHPVKSSESIREAYFDHDVRIFVLDSQDELDKILEVTGYPDDLTLLVRIAVSSAMSKISLAAKFGVGEDEDAMLLQRTRQYAQRLGISFHVGSQAMTPAAYVDALETCRQAIIRSGTFVEIVDVGGGFPSVYPGMQPPELSSYVTDIRETFGRLPATEKCELWCEPGRALSAEAVSLIVRVEARKGTTLYLNDGYYGALFDAGALGWTYPVSVLAEREGELLPFNAYGPTCDDSDYLPGPFYLPESIRQGDHIEIGLMGAYGSVMATGFNGFGKHSEITVGDEPMLSTYLDLNEKDRKTIHETKGSN